MTFREISELLTSPPPLILTLMNDFIWKIAIGFSFIILNIILELSSSNKFDGQIQKIEYNTYVHTTNDWPVTTTSYQASTTYYNNNFFILF